MFSKETIRILSGSENKELSDILSECSKKTGIGIEMTYKGSVDIMNELKKVRKIMMLFDLLQAYGFH